MADVVATVVADSGTSTAAATVCWSSEESPASMWLSFALLDLLFLVRFRVRFRAPGALATPAADVEAIASAVILTLYAKCQTQRL